MLLVVWLDYEDIEVIRFTFYQIGHVCLSQISFFLFPCTRRHHELTNFLCVFYFTSLFFLTYRRRDFVSQDISPNFFLFFFFKAVDKLWKYMEKSEIFIRNVDCMNLFDPPFIVYFCIRRSKIINGRKLSIHKE